MLTRLNKKCLIDIGKVEVLEIEIIFSNISNFADISNQGRPQNFWVGGMIQNVCVFYFQNIYRF